jgi:hypothetical protein
MSSPANHLSLALGVGAALDILIIHHCVHDVADDHIQDVEGPLVLLVFSNLAFLHSVTSTIHFNPKCYA